MVYTLQHKVYPSPCTDLLTRLKLVEELDEVVDWFHLGIYLDIPHFELLTIEQDHRGQTKRCRSEMLQWWLANAEQPSWSAVVRALNGIGLSVLAKKIATKYGKYVIIIPFRLCNSLFNIDILFTLCGIGTTLSQQPLRQTSPVKPTIQVKDYYTYVYVIAVVT